MSESEYQPIPVEIAGKISREFGKSIVVIVAYDRVHALTHVTTFGESAAEKVAAASVGDAIIPLLNLAADQKRGFEDFREMDVAKEREAAEAARGRLFRLLSSILTVKIINTVEWMRWMADQMNEHLRALDDPERVWFEKGELHRVPKCTIDEQ